MSWTPTDYPFSDPNNGTYALGYDISLQEQYPGISYIGSEANSVYYEDREVGGIMYRTQNAQYNKTTLQWSLVNNLSPAYAQAMYTDGTLHMLYKAAGSSAWSTWTDTSLGTYNVKLYGALGNGSTDDTVAVQAAINAANAAGGGTIFFPPGTYILATSSTLTIYSNLIFQGSGQGCTILRSGAFTIMGTNGPTAGQTTTPLSNTLFRDLTFDDNGHSFVALTMPTTAMSNVWLEHCTFENAGGHQCVVFGWAPVFGQGTGGVTVANFTVPGVGVGGTLTYTAGSGPYPPGYYQVQVGSTLIGAGAYVGTVTAISGGPTSYNIGITTVSLGSNSPGGTINGSTNSWALADKSNYCGIRSCVFKSNTTTTYEALGFYQQNGGILEGCTFDANTTNSGHATSILCYGYGEGIRVTNNTFSGNTTGAITFVNHSHSIFANNVVESTTNAGEWAVVLNNNYDLSINHNKFTSSAANIAIAMYDLTSTFDAHPNLYELTDRLTIEGNQFGGNYGIPIEFLPYIPGRNFGFTNVTIRNNRLDNFVNYGIFISGGTADGSANVPNGINIVGNIFPQQGSANYGIYIISNATAPMTRVKVWQNSWTGSGQGTCARFDSVLNIRFFSNDCSGTTTPLNLQGTSTLFDARYNISYNPVGLASSPPAFPATTVTQANTYGVDAMVYITAGAAAVTISITGGTNGTVANFVIPASTMVGVFLPYNASIKPTYASGSPTWVWQLN